MLRRPIVIVGLVILVILLGVFIFNIDWGGSGNTPRTEETKKTQLVDYANTDTKVRMTISGKINSNEDHREIQITVGRDNVDAVVYRGYQGNVVKNQKFSNNPNAYAAFLSALQTGGFTNTRVAADGTSEEGSCPNGQRYIFDVFDREETILHSWSTSCTSRVGTFGGSLSQTRGLFQAQVPDYNKFTSDVRL